MLTHTSHANEFFSHVAWKSLRMIDLPGRGSNQHELQGITALRNMLGHERREMRCRWRGYDPSGATITSVNKSVTWYDARAQNASRAPEWRLYYPPGTPLDDAGIDDLLLVTRSSSLIGHGDDFDISIYVVPFASELASRVEWVLGLERQTDGRLRELGPVELASRPVGPGAWDVLLELEPELQRPRDFSLEELISDEFAEYLTAPDFNTFPSTQVLAAFAWRNCRDVGEPDELLDSWLELESRVFYWLERQMLLAQLARGFDSPDAFIDYSLRVQNRRKARRGKSLERCLARVFELSELQFQTQVRTEGKSTVDFIFPDADTYRRAPEPADDFVVMLGAKSSAKERWRQVLAECKRLKKRHLFTLEAGISAAQTLEMHQTGVSLVVPASIHASFRDAETEVRTLSQFIDYIRTNAMRC